MSLMNNSTPLGATQYTYDSMSRLATVSDGTNTATYTRATGSNLLTNTSISDGTNTVLNRARVYDNLNRLTSITNSVPSVPSVVKSYSYTYNDKDQRTKITFADGSYWDYTYDDKGQVTGGIKYDSTDKAIPGLAFGYSFDDIGNRIYADKGMPQMRYNYTSNDLNQYTQMTVPGIIPVTGKAAIDAKVTVTKGSDSSVHATTRDGKYFKAAVPADNTSAKVTENLTINAVRFDATQDKDIVATTTRTGTAEQTPQTFTYDDDGNMLTNGDWTYIWNGENRLIAAEKSDQRLEYSYDYQGRRFSKKVYTGSTGNWTLSNEEKYVYDNNNRIALYNGSNILQKIYWWGEDLSGSLDGAGGVGGLLAVTDTSSYYSMYDGNGNIMAYVDSSGTSVAEYEYSPFGRILKQTGTKTGDLTYGFSTKNYEFETGILNYRYRQYFVNIGHWMSRDPIGNFVGEKSKMKLNLIYGFVINNPLNYFDKYGFSIFWHCRRKINEGGLADLDIMIIRIFNSQHEYLFIGTDPWNKSTGTGYGFVPGMKAGDRPKVETYEVKPSECKSCDIDRTGLVTYYIQTDNPAQQYEKRTSLRRLEHGHGKGTPCCMATIGQVANCVKNAPAQKDYYAPGLDDIMKKDFFQKFYVCMDWVEDAKKGCCLNCGNFRSSI